LNIWGATRRGVERIRWHAAQYPEFGAEPLGRELEGVAKHELEHFANAHVMRNTSDHLVDNVKSALQGVHRWLFENNTVRVPFEQVQERIMYVEDALKWMHKYLVKRGIVDESSEFEQWLSGLSVYAREGQIEMWPEAAVQIDMVPTSDPAHP